jgi:undecaprenyl-diphosphatase
MGWDIAMGIDWSPVAMSLSMMMSPGLATGLAPVLAEPPPVEVAQFGLVQGIVQALILGLVQGITEFLPISSTAHLLIFTRALNWPLGAKWFVDAIQFGSVVAVAMYFWQDLRQIFAGAWAAFKSRDWQSEAWKVFVGVAIGTLPALGMGLVIKVLLPGDALETTTIIAVMSIVMSLLLGLAEVVGTRKRDFKNIEIKDGFLVGLGQMIALIPGASRSGSTLTTAMLLGFKRETAARFSFLLGLPTLAIATLVQGTEVTQHLEFLMPLIVGVISTFVFSYLSIAWLLNFLKRYSNWCFVWYRLGFAIALLLGLATQVLSNG